MTFLEGIVVGVAVSSAFWGWVIIKLARRSDEKEFGGKP